MAGADARADGPGAVEAQVASAAAALTREKLRLGRGRMVAAVQCLYCCCYSLVYTNAAFVTAALEKRLIPGSGDPTRPRHQAGKERDLKSLINIRASQPE